MVVLSVLFLLRFKVFYISHICFSWEVLIFLINVHVCFWI